MYKFFLFWQSCLAEAASSADRRSWLDWTKQRQRAFSVQIKNQKAKINDKWKDILEQI